MTATTEPVRAVGEWQRDQCTLLGAPTWAAVIDALLGELDQGTAATRLLTDDPGDPATSNVWLRFLGSVHRLALDDPGSRLAAYLPTAGGESNPRGAVAEIDDFVAQHRDDLAREMQRPVQTNEIGRSVALSAAVRWLGGDLHLLELGSSAGLNLQLDNYRYVAESVAWGSPGSPVVLDGFFASGTPPATACVVRTRRGCDLHPIDLADADDVRALRSFVWPDHAERLARLDAAISVAHPVPIDAQGCVEWSHEQLQRLRPGRTVVFHSIVLPYLPPAEIDELTRAIHDAGARATHTDSLAWVSFELAPDADHAEVTVRRWPEQDVHRLARLSPHGDRIRWEVEPLEPHG